MEQVHALQPAILLLFVGILAIGIMPRFRLSPIVGYLLAGVMIGPYGFELMKENETTHLLAELGVVFLLFDIGLHFSLSHLWQARRDILGLGPLQMVLCTAGLTFAFMLGTDLVPELAIVLGATFALSSTAVAIQTIREYCQSNCPIEKSATAVLIFQDICAIFLLILATSAGDSEAALGATIAAAAVKAALAFVIATVIARFVIGPLFSFLARSHAEEIFTATALLVVLATGAATGLMGLSLTLGAFLGGMMISETPYRHVVQTEVKPFRGLLLGFFFITVGMSLNLPVIAEQWPKVLVALGLLLTMKSAIVYLAARIMRAPPRTSVQLASLLSQGSEFVFVIVALPAIAGRVDLELSSTLITAVAASMALTPLLAALGHKKALRLADQAWAKHSGEGIGERDGPAPVVVLGMSEEGRRVADALDDHAIAYKAFEFDHDRFVAARIDGYRVAFGDLADLRLVETIEMAKAKTLVTAVTRERVAMKVSPMITERYPNLQRFIAAATDEQANRFAALGATPIVSHSFPKGVDLAGAVLHAHDVSSEKIEKWMRGQQELALESNPELQVAGSPT